jgi:hypothetical protein
MAGYGPLIAFTIAQLRARVHEAVAAHDFDAAFAAINATMFRAWNTALERGVLNIGAAEIDDLCRLVGRRWLDTHRPEQAGATPTAHPSDLYIASTLYEGGGHTPLIGDFIRSMPTRQAVLALTNLANEPGNVSETILRRVGLTSSQVEVCHSTGLEKKFAWLIDVIERNRPDRIFLFNHPHDGMAIAACQAESAREAVFVHHADRVPSLGAFLASAVHVDVTPFCFHCCRNQGRISGNRFIPLIASDEGVRVRTEARLGFLGLRTAAAGSPHKFLRNYAPNYFDVVAAVLKITQGRHVHIGPLSDDDLKHFRNVLRRHDVDPGGLVHVPHVPSVWRAMTDYDVDFYIGSFPLRGARTSVEVMGSGTPAVWHVTRPASLFHDTHMKYDGAETWQSLEELCDIVRRIDEPWMTLQSRLARLHYERNHHPRLMAACLSGESISSHPISVVAGNSSEPRLCSIDGLLSSG